MVRYILIAALITIAACNSNNEEPLKKDSTRIVVPQDRTPAKADPPPINTAAVKLDIESFGEIRISQSAATTVTVLGQPGNKTKAILWEADGLMHEDWIYTAKGLVLNMAYDEKRKKSKSIYTITATAPCIYTTKANIGIGSSYTEVSAAYKNDIDQSIKEKDQIIVGSVYSGIAFNFKNDTVQRVFLGAMAE